MATVFCSTSLMVEGAVHEMSTAGLNSLQTWWETHETMHFVRYVGIHTQSSQY